jgi:hypothetical protein
MKQKLSVPIGVGTLRQFTGGLGHVGDALLASWREGDAFWPGPAAICFTDQPKRYTVCSADEQRAIHQRNGTLRKRRGTS